MGHARSVSMGPLYSRLPPTARFDAGLTLRHEAAPI
jgi:hypothetical protein